MSMPAMAPLGRRLDFGARLGQVIQFAYVVPNLQDAIARYVETFGVGPWFVRGPFTPPAARYLGEPTGLTLSLARAFIGDMMVEFIEQHDDGPSVYRQVIDAGYGFHHWAIGTDDPDADIGRFATAGYPVVFQDRVPSGARVIYVDATKTLPGMIEILEMNEQQHRLYTEFYSAARHWDGREPIRVG